MAFTNATLPFLLAMGEAGIEHALKTSPALSRGAVYVSGELQNAVVAELTGEPCA